MSDCETPRDRSKAPSRSDERARPKRKPKGKSKRDKTPECSQPYTQSDDLCDVTIKAARDKRFYTNSYVLVTCSPVLKEQLMSDNAGGKKGKGKQSSSTDKEVDWSDMPLCSAIKMMDFFDPRVFFDVTDEEAISVAPCAKKYEMEALLKTCEKKLTTSFYQMRRNRRVPPQAALQYLEAADTCDFKDLRQMAMESCVRNPYINNSQITQSSGLSDKTKIEILQRKLERNRQAKKDTARAGSERSPSH